MSILPIIFPARDTGFRNEGQMSFAHAFAQFQPVILVDGREYEQHFFTPS
jgi:hypothetical protein